MGRLVVRTAAWPGVRFRLRVRLWFVVAEQLVEQLLIQSRGIKGFASATMRQRQQGRNPNVGAGDPGASLPGGVGTGGPCGDDVSAHPVDIESRADLGDLAKHRIRKFDIGYGGLCGCDPGGKLLLLGLMARPEPSGIGVEGHPPADDLDANTGIPWGHDLDREPKPVEQLGPQLSLLWVHGANQHHLGGVGDGDAVTLNGVAPHGGCVQQQIHQVIVQQVHLIDVEDAAIGTSQQTRFEGSLPLAKRCLKIE